VHPSKKEMMNHFRNYTKFFAAVFVIVLVGCSLPQSGNNSGSKNNQSAGLKVLEVVTGLEEVIN
jgi:hypothetical protein